MLAEMLARKASKVPLVPLGWPRRRRPGDVVILLYHRVGVEAREIGLPVDTFRQHLEWLSERQVVLTLDEALAGMRGGVVVTFDDGYRDFADHVVPALIRAGVPAVLYLATSLATNGVGGDGVSWSALSDAVDTGLVTVGSHTHGHTDLSSADEHLAEAEMRRSKDLIEERLGVECRHFAYPWSVGSPTADRLARGMFESAALDVWRTNRRGSIDPYRLGRTPVLRSDGQVFFRAKVQGTLDPEALLYRALGRGPWRRA